MKAFLARSAKAVVGGAIGALGYLAPASSGGVTTGEWLGAAAAFLVGFNAVYWTRNRRA